MSYLPTDGAQIILKYKLITAESFLSSINSMFYMCITQLIISVILNSVSMLTRNTWTVTFGKKEFILSSENSGSTSGCIFYTERNEAT